MSETLRDRKPPGRRGAVRITGTAYKFEHLLLHAAHVESPELWWRLLERLEEENFLARQSEQPDGFEIGARQLERLVLPAVIQLGDWERFFQYLLTAANLRGLAGTLDDPTILRALARSGRLDLAEALVGRLPHPAARARGWAVLAGVPSPATLAFDRLVSALQAELDGMPGRVGSDGEAEARHWGGSLATAGRLLAPRLRARWPEWIACLAPWSELADDARIAVAEGFFDAGEPEAPELWQILSEVESPELLRRFLPDRLAEVGYGDPGRWLGVLRSWLPQAGSDPRLTWSVGIGLLSRCGDRGAAEWPWLRTELDMPGWDRDLLERGAMLWPRLSDGELRDLAPHLDDPDLVALLQVLVLEGRLDGGSYQTALGILSGLGQGAQRLSLYLRALGASPPALRREVRARTKALLAYLAETQYALPASDLRRALDLVARHLPRRLRGVVDAALSALGSGPETLRTLSAEGQEEGLLQELFLRAEAYAAMAAGSAAEGFELRGEILVLLTCRLIQRSRDLAMFRPAAERLLPEEEDRLRSAAARTLGPGASELTEELCDGIEDRRLQLQVRLEILPDGADPGDLVAPAALYRAAVRLDPIEDELRALGGLLSEPRQPARLAEEHFEGMRSLGRRVEALADLARHSLSYQAREFPPERQDRLAAILPLKETLGVIESDAWLLALTPELVAIGSHLGLREAVAEVQEAFERIAELETIPWGQREEILIDVLGLLDPLFLDGGPAAPLGHVSETVRGRRATELLTWLVRFPERVGETEAGQRLRQRWYRFLPCLTAMGERLEPSSPAWSQRLGWLVRLSPSLPSVLEDSAHRGRAWAPGREAIFDLCVGSSSERLQRAGTLVRRSDDGADPETVHALSWLLSRDAPDSIPPLLSCLKAGPGRDRFLLELLQNAPLPGRDARELVRLLTPEDGARHWGQIWLGLQDDTALPEGRWVASVAALVASDELDPADPRTAPARRRLWRVSSGETVTALAESALGALARGGQPGSERAARIFLNAYVQPVTGAEAPPEASRRHAEMWRAVERARNLETHGGKEPPIGSEAIGESDGPAAPRGLLARFQRWRRSWDRRPRKLGEERVHGAKALTFLTGLAAIPVLPQFQAVLFNWDDVPQVGQEAVLWAAAALGLLVLGNGVLIGSYLRWSTPGEETIRRPVRWLRTTLASLPIFGLWMIPFWRWLHTKGSRWTRRDDWEEPVGLPEAGARRWSLLRLHSTGSARVLGRWAGRPAAVAGLFLVNLAVVTAVAHTLSGTEVGRLPMVWGVVLLHGLFFAGMLAGLIWWVQDRRLAGWQAVLLPALSVCWLVPVPALPLLGLVAWILLDSEAATETLSHHAFSAAGGMGRLPAWLRFEDRLRREWGTIGWRLRFRGPPESIRAEPKPTDVERKLLWFFQGKGAALFFEAALLAGGLEWASRPLGPANVTLFGGLLLVVQGLSLTLGAVALVGLGVVLAREIFRPETGGRVFGPRLFWGHLAGTQWALFLGLLLGTGLSRSDFAQAGGALAVLGVGGAFLQVGALFVGMLLRSMPERPGGTAIESVVKVILYCGAGTLGVDLTGGSMQAAQWVPLLADFQYLAPVFGAVLGFGGLRWLLHGELRATLLATTPSWRARRLTFLLVLTAVAPLGGLAIPWWIRLRGAGTAPATTPRDSGP